MRWKAASLLLAGAMAIGAIAWQSRQEPTVRPPLSNPAEPPMAKGASAPGHEPHEVRSPRALSGARGAEFWRRHKISNISGLRRQADQGNVIAQRKLGEAYQRCLAVLASPSEDYMGGVRRMAEHLPTAAERELLMGAADFRLQQCRSLGDGKVVHAEDATLWLDIAAEGGDLRAQAIAASRSPLAVRSERMAVAWEHALAAADGPALNALLGSEDSAGFTRYFATIVDADDALAVMSVVACRTGAACQAGGEMMLDLCLEAFHCSDRSFEELVWQHGELGDREFAVRTQIEDVLRAIDLIQRAE